MTDPARAVVQKQPAPRTRTHTLARAMATALIVAAAGGLWMLFQQLQAPPDPALTLTIDRGEVLHATGATPVALSQTGWQPAPLPFDFRERAAHEQEVWLRFQFDFNTPPDRLWGMFVPQVEQGLAAYLNREIIGTTGRLTPTPLRHTSEPYYVMIGNGMLQSGRNELLLRVRTYPPGRGYLGPIYLGPDVDLAPVFSSHRLARTDLPRLFNYAALVSTFVIMIIAAMRRHDRIYAWLATTSILWCLVSLLLQSKVTWPNPDAWRALTTTVTCWFAASAFIFSLRFFNIAARNFEHFTLGAAGLAAVLMALALMPLFPDGFVFQFTPWVLGVFLATGPIVVALCIRQYRKDREWAQFLALACGLVLMVFGAFDVAVHAGTTSATHGRFGLYATPLLLVALVLLFVTRFVRALDDAESLARNLERRVIEKSAQLAAAERDRVLAAERERIMRDMHDGVGGHLVSSLALLREHGDMPAALNETLNGALTDLRLMIDSLDEFDGDLAALLGNLRARLQPLLDHARIESHWQIEELPDYPLTPDTALAVMRILQEAVTNVIKHSQAKHVHVRASATNCGAVEVVLSDDGVGISVDELGDGRGMSNMHRRAELLGASLSISRAAQGTCVRLTMPVSG